MFVNWKGVKFKLFGYLILFGLILYFILVLVGVMM